MYLKNIRIFGFIKQACPLNNHLSQDANANKSDLDDFSESFTPAIKSVVDFAKGIPGFTLLNQDDQVTLLKVFALKCSNHACMCVCVCAPACMHTVFP